MDTDVYLHCKVYLPVFTEKVAAYTGIRFANVEEAQEACDLAHTLEIQCMDKAGSASQVDTARRRAGQQLVTKSASAIPYAVRQLANQPDIAQCLDQLDW